MKGKRRKFSAAFKVSVAIEAIKDLQTLSELSKRFEVHPNIISKWKKEFLEKSSSVFDHPSGKDDRPDTEKLYAKIGQLELENNFLKKSLKKLD